MIIAIDGPAGSGKSTTAREVARRLDALYIDTGAMYRAVALYFMQNRLKPEDDLSTHVVDAIEIDLLSLEADLHIILNGKDVTDEIRQERVSAMASRVSRLEQVRNHLVSQQQRIAADASTAGRPVVMEGRDIGTVVFPEADFKFFMTADARVRAERRARQLEGRGEEVDLQMLYDDIVQRDRSDATRAMSPLMKAEDAVVVDTTSQSFEDQVEFILRTIAGNDT